MTTQGYLLSLTEHADKLSETFPGLVPILGRTQFRERAGRFKNADDKAIQRQSNFRLWAMMAQAGMGATTVMTALALALSPTWAYADAASDTLGSAAVVAGALSTAALFKLRQGNKLRRWMEARAEAETERLEYFKAVVAAVPAGDAAILEQALDYVCEFQLNVQKNYYAARGARHERAADTLLLLAAAAAGLGGLGGVAVLAGSSWLAPLGVFCTAVASFVAAQEGIGQDKRNAERYGRTWTFLSKIAEEVDEVRDKVKEGDKAALVDWLKRLHEYLSLEHREWRAQADSVEAVLAEKPKGQAPAPPDGQE